MVRRKRNYRREYDDYHGTSEQKSRRAQRGRDRYKAERAGRVRKGDGKEVHHSGARRKGSSLGRKTSVINKNRNRRMQPKRS